MDVKLTSKLLLAIARRTPRGYWPLIRTAARMDPSLQDFPIALRNTSTPLRADLRESVFIPLYRHGYIPHQMGFDKVCRRLLRRGDVVYDIGANVGYTAAVYSGLVGPEGSVLAIEPSPRAFALLTRSLSGLANVTLIRTGVSSTGGDLTFHVPPTLDTASVVPIEGADKVSIHVTTVHALAGTYPPPQFIKIDVEGHEPEVFTGARDTLGRVDCPFVIFEALDECALGRSLDALNQLSRARYRVMRIRNDGALVALGGPGSSDYLAVPPWGNDRLSSQSRPATVPAADTEPKERMSRQPRKA